MLAVRRIYMYHDLINELLHYYTIDLHIHSRYCSTIWLFKYSKVRAFVLSGTVLFLDTPCFNRYWDPSIVNEAGWGCSHWNYKVDYHDNKMCPLGKGTMWSMKGRTVPPALIGVVWFGCSSPCSWNWYQMAHEHYNRSNFPNIFNFHRTEMDPGVRQQNRALCQLLIPKR